MIGRLRVGLELVQRRFADDLAACVQIGFAERRDEPAGIIYRLTPFGREVRPLVWRDPAVGVAHFQSAVREQREIEGVNLVVLRAGMIGQLRRDCLAHAGRGLGGRVHEQRAVVGGQGALDLAVLSVLGTAKVAVALLETKGALASADEAKVATPSTTASSDEPGAGVPTDGNRA